MPDDERRFKLHFHRGDLLFAGSDYQIVDKDGSDEPTGEEARPIASGGAGVIYRARYKRRMERAIKILNPRASLPHDLAKFQATFEDEIGLLARATHHRISKITDFGTDSIQDVPMSYYVMEYIDGVTLDAIWSQSDCTGATFLQLLDHVLEGLEYLHTLSPDPILHTDLKEENILVRHHGSSYAATIVDLGVSKAIVRDYQSRGLSDRVAFYSTRSLLPAPLPSLAWGREIDRDYLNKTLFPFLDLHFFGLLIAKVKQHHARLYASLRGELGVSGLAALARIQERLNRSPDNLYYKSVSDLRRDSRKLSREYLSPLGIPELSLAANVATLISLPTRRVAITERIGRVIDHPLFQRLRYIHQLEFHYYSYPGATHTRFAHSLATFDEARQYISHLLNDAAFRLDVEPHQIEATLLWALLHDIGHYPLSHMFEDFTQPPIPSDDDLFWSFVGPGNVSEGPLVEYGARVERRLQRGAASRLGQTPLAEVIDDQFGHQVIETLATLTQPSSPAQQMLAGLISSPVDVDKMAYLLDDSTMTGVRYGLGIDHDGLMTALMAPTYDDVNRVGGPVMAVQEKGLAAAESVVLARYWMLSRVYWHHTNRSIMAMVKFVISELMRSGILRFPAYFEQSLFETETWALKYLSGKFDRAIQTGDLGKDGPITNPLLGLVDGNRAFYKRVLTIAHAPDDIDRQLYERLAFKPWPELAPCVTTLREVIQQVVGAPTMVAEGDVLLDAPAKQRELMGGPVLVYFQREPTRGEDLIHSASSPILQALGTAFDRYVKKCRVYVHPMLYEAIEPRLAEVQAKARRALLEATGVSR